MSDSSFWIRIQIIRVFELKLSKNVVQRLESMLIFFIKRNRTSADVALITLFIMFRCNHISLLRIAEDKEVCLLDDDWLDRVMQSMTNSFAQYSSLQFFIERKAKDLTLSELFSHNNVQRDHQDRNCVINFYLNVSFISCNRSILFINSDSLFIIYRSHETVSCHRTTSHSVLWIVTSNHSLYDILHAWLFFLFTDVICIFADNFKNHESVTDHLNTWATIEFAVNLLREIRSRVVIVVFDQVKKQRRNKQS